MGKKRRNVPARRFTKSQQIGVAAACVTVTAVIAATRPQVLWYPRNELDLLLAVLLGTAAGVVGFIGVLASIPKSTRLYGEEPRTPRLVALTWAMRSCALVLAVGATIAAAGALDLFSSPFLRRFDAVTWGMVLPVASLLVYNLYQFAKKNGKPL